LGVSGYFGEPLGFVAAIVARIRSRELNRLQVSLAWNGRLKSPYVTSRLRLSLLISRWTMLTTSAALPLIDDIIEPKTLRRSG